MKVFGFDPSLYRETYTSQQWVHVPGGIDPEFFGQLREFVRAEFSTHVVTGRAIGGSKEQALYEFPGAVAFPEHLFDVVAEITGLRRETMTLSERHIKAYDADAPEEPVAHKDRLSSQVSVGLSIEIPQASSLVLYPEDERQANMFNVSAALRESLEPDQLPEVALRDAREVVIHDRPGDVVIFAGSSMWHLRRRGAGVVNLYLKFNDFDSDPLGEDPTTAMRRESTLVTLGGDSLLEATARPARRLDTVTRRYTRDRWLDVAEANVWNETPVSLSPPQLELLQSLDGGCSVRALTERAQTAGRTADEVIQDLRRLGERGVIDLL